MTFIPCDYELKVLKYAAGYPQPDLIAGAAINAAFEFLEEAGFVYRRNGKITERGLKYLEDNHHI